MLDLEVIRELPRLLLLETEWSKFVDGLERQTPFQTPDWMLTWWQHFGGGELYVLVFRDDAEIAGIIPCFLHEWDGRRQLTLMGSGVSDYLEPPVRHSRRQEVLHGLREHLHSSHEWEICNWQDLAADGFLSNLETSDRLDVEKLPDLPCTTIPIKGCFDSYWAERPSGLRRNVRRYAEKARGVDTPEFEVTGAYRGDLLETLIQLHSARWQEQGESGMITANRSGGFLRDVTARFAARKMLLTFSLLFQQQTAAIILSFPYRNALFSYLSAFDPEYSSLGLGKLLLYEAVRYTFQRGYSAWEFLRGPEPYKLEWGVVTTPKLRLIIRHQGDRH